MGNFFTVQNIITFLGWMLSPFFAWLYNNFFNYKRKNNDLDKAEKELIYRIERMIIDNVEITWETLEDMMVVVLSEYRLKNNFSISLILKKVDYEILSNDFISKDDKRGLHIQLKELLGEEPESHKNKTDEEEINTSYDDKFNSLRKITITYLLVGMIFIVLSISMLFTNYVIKRDFFYPTDYSITKLFTLGVTVLISSITFLISAYIQKKMKNKNDEKN